MYTRKQDFSCIASVKRTVSIRMHQTLEKCRSTIYNCVQVEPEFRIIFWKTFHKLVFNCKPIFSILIFFNYQKFLELYQEFLGDYFIRSRSPL